jgi:hypothetical protein
MNSNTKNTPVDPQNSEDFNSNEKPAHLMSVPVTLNEKTRGTGQFYKVWDKKDLGGKPQNMSQREDDVVTNHGEEVTDPISGTKVHLVRIKRNGQRRVWYSVAVIMTQTEIASESAK